RPTRSPRPASPCRTACPAGGEAKGEARPAPAEVAAPTPADRLCRRRHAMITPETSTTSDALLDPLLDARRVELALLDDLTDAQMLGARGHFLEPPIWEMGHVGWFQEYWLQRRLDCADTILPGAAAVYD